jgi:hypothetical protein
LNADCGLRNERRSDWKPQLWLIRLIGVLVPRRLRSDWRQEWEAELQYRETLPRGGSQLELSLDARLAGCGRFF